MHFTTNSKRNANIQLVFFLKSCQAESRHYITLTNAKLGNVTPGVLI